MLYFKDIDLRRAKKCSSDGSNLSLQDEAVYDDDDVNNNNKNLHCVMFKGEFSVHLPLNTEVFSSSSHQQPELQFPNNDFKSFFF